MPDDNLPFRAEGEAMIKLGDATRAPVLSYDVPQPAEYNGRHFLELLFEDTIWNASAKPKPPATTTGGGNSGGGGGKPLTPTRPDLFTANMILKDAVHQPVNGQQRERSPPAPT